MAGVAAKRSIWRVFWSDFGHATVKQDLTNTLHMLNAAKCAQIGVIVVWAIADAFLEARGRGGALFDQSTGGLDRLALQRKLVFAVFESLHHAGGILAFCLATYLIGALLGFLFGIPRPLSSTEGAAHATGAANGATRASVRRRWEASTNLTQVSDWLTKIIIGLGLVEARQIAGDFAEISNNLAKSIFTKNADGPSILMISGITAFVIGFLYLYLYTQLVVARLLAEADEEIGAATPDDIDSINSIDAFKEVLAGRISIVPADEDTPTPQEVILAWRVGGVPLAGLSDLNRIRAWARAKAILNDYGSAAEGYDRLILRLSEFSPQQKLEVLLEAARVMIKVDQKRVARRLLDTARRMIDANEAMPGGGPAIDAQLRSAIIADTVTLLLDGDDAAAASQVLTKYYPPVPGNEVDPFGRIALGKAVVASRQVSAILAKGDKASQEEKDGLVALRQSIRDNLPCAIKGQSLTRVRRYFAENQLSGIDRDSFELIIAKTAAADQAR